MLGAGFHASVREASPEGSQDHTHSLRDWTRKRAMRSAITLGCPGLWSPQTCTIGGRPSGGECRPSHRSRLTLASPDLSLAELGLGPRGLQPQVSPDLGPAKRGRRPLPASQVSPDLSLARLGLGPKGQVSPDLSLARRGLHPHQHRRSRQTLAAPRSCQTGSSARMHTNEVSPDRGQRPTHTNEVSPDRGQRPTRTNEVLPDRGQRPTHTNEVSPDRGQRPTHTNEVSPDRGQRPTRANEVSLDRGQRPSHTN